MNARHWPVQKPNGQWTHAIGQFKNPTANECTPLASSKTQQPIKAWPIWCRSNKVQDIGLFKNPTANQCPHTLRLSDKAHVIGLLKYEQPLTWWRFNEVSVPPRHWPVQNPNSQSARAHLVSLQQSLGSSHVIGQLLWRHEAEHGAHPLRQVAEVAEEALQVVRV